MPFPSARETASPALVEVIEIKASYIFLMLGDQSFEIKPPIKASPNPIG